MQDILLRLRRRRNATDAVHRRRTGLKGFTIIELMIVVSIIAILVAVSLPTVYNYRKERVGIEAARDIADRLRGLQRMAVTSNRALTLRIFRGDGGERESSAQRGAIQVFASPDNRCYTPTGAADANRVRQAELSFNEADVNPPAPATPNQTAVRFRFENVQMVAVSPAPGGSDGSVLDLCIKPDGRVVQLDTIQPTEAGGMGACPGDAAADYPAGVASWDSECNRAGVVCIRVANLNDACPDRCPDPGSECPSRYGIDHYVQMTFTGQTRLIQ